MRYDIKSKNGTSHDRVSWFSSSAFRNTNPKKFISDCTDNDTLLSVAARLVID